MKPILTAILATIMLQSYAVQLPNDSVAKQVQNALYAFKPNTNTSLEYAKLIDTKKLFTNDEDYKQFGNQLSSETIAALIQFNAVDFYRDIYKRSSVHHQARLMLDKALKKNDPIGAYIAYRAAREVNDMKYATYAIHKASDAGIPAAQYELAEDLNKDKNNKEQVLELYKSAVENGYKKAYAPYGFELYNSGSHKEAIKWLEKAIKHEVESPDKDGVPFVGTASNRYIQSVELLANIYLDGEGVENKKDKAFELMNGLIRQIDGKASMTEIQSRYGSKQKSDYYKKQTQYWLDKSQELSKMIKAESE